MTNGETSEERPPLGAGLIVLGVAQILWGLLEMCGGIWGALSVFMQPVMLQTGQKNPMLDLFETHPAMKYLTVVQNALAAVIGLAFLIGAVGLLLRVIWGRGLSVGASIAQLAQVLVGTTWACIVVLPHFLNWMDAADPMQKSAGMVGAIGIGCSGLISPIFPIIALIVLTRPAVRAQFR